MSRNTSAAFSFPKSAPTLVDEIPATRRIPKFDLAAVVAELEALEERSHDEDVTIEAPAPSEQPELGSPLGDDDDEGPPATSRMPKVEEQALIHWELELSRSGMREISRVLPPLVTAPADVPPEEDSAIKHVVIGLWSLAIAMTVTLGYLMATAQ